MTIGAGTGFFLLDIIKRDREVEKQQRNWFTLFFRNVVLKSPIIFCIYPVGFLFLKFKICQFIIRFGYKGMGEVIEKVIQSEKTFIFLKGIFIGEAYHTDYFIDLTRNDYSRCNVRRGETVEEALSRLGLSADFGVLKFDLHFSGPAIVLKMYESAPGQIGYPRFLSV